MLDNFYGMNKITALLGVVLVLVSAGFVYYFVTLPETPVVTVYEEETFVFVDGNGGELTVQYDESAELALVTFADTEYELLQVAAGTGTRYESSNGLVVFTEQLGEARLEVAGELVAVGVLPETVPLDEGVIGTVTDLQPVVLDGIAVVDVPVLGQRCVDSATVDCAALEAAARQ